MMTNIEFILLAMMGKFILHWGGIAHGIAVIGDEVQVKSSLRSNG
jgi:hypothetical protein